MVVDPDVLAVWRSAQGRSLDEILSGPPLTCDLDELRAALACLAEAGLLERHPSGIDSVGTHPETIAAQPSSASLPAPVAESVCDQRRVSVILVGFQSRVWLEGSLGSLQAQTCPPLDIIFVDNASQDGSADWVAAHYPQVQIIRLAQPQSLASALNLGIQAARGDYYCLLNPDLRLAPGALASMVQVAQNHPSCAAVAAKLRLLFTPAFLNGLGNFVGAFSWGSDCALGHLDLGQFEAWDELPSACFAAALIPASVVRSVGPLDETFPMYYEDSEWCYRARLLGYSIRAAPAAVVYHAFGGQTASKEPREISAHKLRCVVYGRLRFISLLNGSQTLRHFLIRYVLEDLLRASLALFSFRFQIIAAYSRAWADFRRDLTALRHRRREIQSLRKCTDAEIYRLQKGLPQPSIWKGLPVLTWDVICRQYLPLIAGGQIRPLPEFTGLEVSPVAPRRKYLIDLGRRVVRLWRAGGPGWLFYWLVKDVQWRLMQVGRSAHGS